MMTSKISHALMVSTLALGTVAWGTPVPQTTINSNKDLKLAVKSAKTPQDHERIAAYYKAQADQLEAQAAQYEEAAANYRNGPVVKNLMAPNTAARYEAMAKDFRDQAQSKRNLAVTQEQLAHGARTN